MEANDDFIYAVLHYSRNSAWLPIYSMRACRMGWKILEAEQVSYTSFYSSVFIAHVSSFIPKWGYFRVLLGNLFSYCRSPDLRGNNSIKRGPHMEWGPTPRDGRSNSTAYRTTLASVSPFFHLSIRGIRRRPLPRLCAPLQYLKYFYKT